jgi:hypothetical protein
MPMSRVGHLGWRYSRQWLAPSSHLARSHHYDQQDFVQGFHQGTTPTRFASIDFVVPKLFLYRSYPEVMVEQLVRILGKKLCIRKEKSLDGLLPPPWN